MYDPIGGFYRIRELYITYLETAFRIGEPAVSAERRALLEGAGTLCTEPLLEPLPRYRAVDWSLRELAHMDDGPLAHFSARDRQTLVRLLSSGLFEGDDRAFPATKLVCERTQPTRPPREVPDELEPVGGEPARDERRLDRGRAGKNREVDPLGNRGRDQTSARIVHAR